MKLYYFDIPGRAEIVRLTLRYGEVPFEDVRFTGEEWRAKYKSISPTGQVPMLELDDGTMMCQSIALSLYAAELANMLPKDALSRARFVELSCGMEDALKALATTFAIPDAGDKVAARRKLLEAPDGALHKGLNILNTMVADAVARGGGDFYLGSDPSVCDFSVFVMFNSFASGFMDGITKTDMLQFPALATLRDNVANLSKVKAMYADATGTYEAYKH